MAREATQTAAPLASAEERALSRMLLIRAVEERLLSLFSEGKLFGTTHTCIGQETCAVAVVGALDLEKDIIFSTHRCHGHFLMYADDPDALIAEVMGRETGVCGGRGGSQHLCRRNFYSNGIQGGIVPVASGVALAEKVADSKAVTVCFLGDGTLGEGVIYESFNLASLWELPILFVVEHNRYAQSTPTARTTAGDVTARAEAFGIATDRRSADDPIALEAHMREVVERVRREGKPFFQVLDTYRLAAHSKGDDERHPDEVAHHRSIDPLGVLRARVPRPVSAALEEQIEARVELAVKAAESAPYAVVDPAADVAAFERRGHVAGIRPALAPNASDPSRLVVHQLNDALHKVMDERDDVVLIGEDLVDPYGGAFKVSRGLSSRFPKRVLSSPISEAAIIGLGSGLGLRGLRPVVEIMFGDFLALGADQVLNHLAKFRWMYDEQVETPVVIRTPVGGHRGYGPTHSQSIEKMFLGMPGLVVVAISARHDPGELLRHAIVCDPRPVLFLEQKILYAKRLAATAPAGTVFELPASERDALYPTAIWRPQGMTGDVTVVTYGAMTESAESALRSVFEEDEVLAEYLVVSQLAPLRVDPILESVRRTGRLLVVEEGTEPWGFGAEVLARVIESTTDRAIRCGRVAAHHVPIPNARPAEALVLPDAERIANAIRSLMR